MMLSKYRAYWLPVILSVIGCALLIRILVLNTLVLLPEHTDVVLLVVLLAFAIVVAIHTLVRISLNYLRRINIQRARRETLAEHRRFLHRLDHELKNPLTALKAGLKTLTLTELTPQQRTLIQTMETETARISQLVTDLRKLAELETQALDQHPTDIEVFIANIARIEQERFEAGHRHFVNENFISRKIWVFDEDLLALAIHNLLDNAYKYSHSGDTITMEVHAQQELIIRIADTGIGIVAEALPYVREELYRAEHNEKIAGSGIGLALVQAIVEQHNGTLSIESEPASGTTVTIQLPSILQN